jgi:hypothetical protein
VRNQISHQYKKHARVWFSVFYLNTFDITNNNKAPYLVRAVRASYSVYTIRITVIPMTSFHMLVVVGPICEFSTAFSTAVRTLTGVLPAVNLMQTG